MLPILTDAIAFAQGPRPPPPRGVRMDIDEYDRFCWNCSNACAVSRIVFSRGWMQAQAPRIQYFMGLQPAAHRILKNATSFFNLSQFFLINANCDDEGYYNAESIDRFLGDMLKPTFVAIYGCSHPSANDAFVRDVILAKYSGTVEMVCFDDCPHITPAAYVAMLRAPASYELRCATCIEVRTCIVRAVSPHKIVAWFTPDLFRALIDMIDERADTSGKLCESACSLFVELYSHRHVSQPTQDEVAALLSRVVWMLDHDNQRVVFNATTLFLRLVQKCPKLVVSSGILAAVIALLIHIGSTARTVRQNEVLLSSVLVSISLVVQYLRDNDRGSDIAALIMRHHLLEALQTLVEKFNTSVFASQQGLGPWTLWLFDLIDNIVRVPQLPGVIEFVSKVLPACAAVVCSFFRDHPVWEDSMSQLVQQTATPIVALPTFQPHDAQLSFSADHGLDSLASQHAAQVAAVNTLRQRTAKQREDDLRIRLRCFNDTLDLCNNMTPTGNNGGALLGTEIYQRFIHFAGWLRANGRIVFDAERVAERALLMLATVAEDSGVIAAAKAQRAQALQRTAATTTAAADNSHHQQRRRARDEDRDGDDVESLRSRAAAHLLEICGGAASSGEDSRLLKACQAFVRKSSTDTTCTRQRDQLFPMMRPCSNVILENVFQAVFGVLEEGEFDEEGSETVKLQSAAATGGAGAALSATAAAAARSNARRPHSRGLASTLPTGGAAAAGGGLASPARYSPQRKSTSPESAAMKSIFTPAATAPPVLVSPMKPSSARAVAAARQSPPRRVGMTPPPLAVSRQHTDASRRSNPLFHDSDSDGGGVVLASEVVPDVQLCVNYKKVDITVNDAKKHLRVRPPRIRAAATELQCTTQEVVERASLFSVDCGLDDVGVDHSVLFFVVAANPECFAVQPTVDCEGTLRFETAPPAPGSVHLDGTSLLVTAWDALSLAGSSITQHADEPHELEEGVPFCAPIKLTIKLTHAGGAGASLNNTTISSPNNRRSPSPGRSGAAAASADAAAASSAAAAPLVRFPRINPNTLRDPFVVLGAQLQERLVGAVPCPLTDTEIVCLPFVRALFFGSRLGPGAVVLDAASDEASLRAELQRATPARGAAAATQAADAAQTQLAGTALERLGRYLLERGAAQGGDGTVVEVMEQLVSLRRRAMRAAADQQQQQRAQQGVEALQLLMALNCLAAAEVAAGSMADASSTLDNAVQLSGEFEAVVDDADAVWILLRAAYVHLVRGDAEAALRILRRPAVAEVDTVFPDRAQMRAVFHLLGTCARCALARYGEAIRKLKQLIAAQEQQLELDGGSRKPRNDLDTTSVPTGKAAAAAASSSSSSKASVIPLLPLRQALILACVRAGDMVQARQVLQTIKAGSGDDAGDDGDAAASASVEQQHDRLLERSVTCLLMNMANLYSELPDEVKRFIRTAAAAGDSGSGSNILRSPATVVRAVDAWQALSLDPHSLGAREFLAAQLAGSGSSGGAGGNSRRRDLVQAKLRVLDAAVTVATSTAAVSGACERQRAAVDSALQRLRRELSAHHRDVVGTVETLAWLCMCSAAALTPTGGAVGAGDVSQLAAKARALCEKSLNDLLAFGVDVNRQAPRLAQLMCHACGAAAPAGGDEGAAAAATAIPVALHTATQEALDECLMRFGDGTRALFTPLVDRAIAEINAGMFPAALEKLHRALKIADSGNAIFLLGPLFRPAAQLTPEELAERTRLSKGRVDARAALDFAVVLFAMATVAEAERRLFDAETLLLQVLAALELAGVEETVSTAAVYRAMSQLLFEDGHFGDALAYIERAEKLLHTKFHFAHKLRGEVCATQQFIQFQIRTAGYGLKRVADSRFKFAVFV